jgi:hypothetical protein
MPEIEHSKLLMLHRDLTEEIAPFMTITGVDSTFNKSAGNDSADRIVFQLLSCSRPDNI